MRMKKRPKMTYKEIARLSGVESSYVSRLLRGYRPNPSINVCVDIARAMNLTLDELCIRLGFKGLKSLKTRVPLIRKNVKLKSLKREAQLEELLDAECELEKQAARELFGREVVDGD